MHDEAQLEDAKNLVKCSTNLFTTNVTCDQSYKQFTLVIYDSRVIPDLKVPHITTLDT